MLVTRAGDAFFIRRLFDDVGARKRVGKNQYSLLRNLWFEYEGVLRSIIIHYGEHKLYDHCYSNGQIHAKLRTIQNISGLWIYTTNMIPCGDSMRSVLVVQSQEYVLYTIQLRENTISVIDSQVISSQSCSPAIHAAYDSVTGKLHKFIFKHNHVAMDIDSGIYYTASGAIIDIVIHGGIVTLYGNDTIDQFNAGSLLSRRVIPRVSSICVVGDFLTARVSERTIRIHDVRTDDEYDISIADDENYANVIPVFCTTKLKSHVSLCMSGNDRNTC